MMNINFSKKLKQLRKNKGITQQALANAIGEKRASIANYEIAFDIEENWYRQDNKLLGNKEFLVQDPDGYLLRFSKDLGEISLK